ncbi:hypothetical protein ACIXMS_19310 [Bacteroides fragilis]|nr:hypothetical protein [Bacteroides fragilis]
MASPSSGNGKNSSVQKISDYSKIKIKISLGEIDKMGGDRYYIVCTLGKIISISNYEVIE